MVNVMMTASTKHPPARAHISFGDDVLDHCHGPVGWKSCMNAAFVRNVFRLAKYGFDLLPTVTFRG